MADHRITLTTRDGHELVFTCADGGDVVSAGEAASILLPSLCRDGGCGACLGHCAEGDYTLGSHNAGVLSEEAAARRDVLLCRTYPQSDLRITAPYDYAHIQFGRHKSRQAVITGLETVAERTVRLRLSWQDGEDGMAVEFEPGQCMELEIPGTDIRRAYSLANTGNWRGEMEFLIRLQPEGRFSTYLSRQAEVGQVLNVYGPGGAFGLQADSFNPAIFIAGGTGLAPFLSILRRMAEWGEDRSIHLLFGVNRESELFYLDELRDLQQQLPGLAVTPCVWQPSADWSGFSGTPADALERHLRDQPDEYDLYLCGPPPLVAAATQTALRQGIGDERIFSEKFA
jgi:ferredoxin-NADP reductase/ferredoxin